MSLREVFAINMRKFRKSAGLTQEDLAEKSGFHRTYIGGVEQQRINLSLDNIERIANALNVAPALLFMQDQEGSVQSSIQNSNHANDHKHYALCMIEANEIEILPLDIDNLSLTTHILCTLIQEGYEGQDLVNRYKKTQQELVRFFNEHSELL